MKIIPKSLVNKAPESEKKIFNIFKNIEIGSEWTLFHSLNINEHDYKKFGEIDFVLLGPSGLFCFEVKGGRISCNDEGIWFTRNRKGEEERLPESPFEQAKSGSYALLKMLAKYKNIDIKKNFNWGFGVIFPDITWGTTISTEFSKEIICDIKIKKDINKFKEYIRKLIRYYSNKNTKEQIPKKTLNDISNYFRPVLDKVPSLSITTNELYEKIVEMTDEQIDFFKGCETNKRIVCTGGAGTGKTFLVRSSAINEAEDGAKVLVTAKHQIFISYLKKQFEKFQENQNISIIPFDGIKKKIDEYKLFFDCIVVDESQDVMNFEDIDILDKILKNGIKNGRFRLFLDENAQAGLIGKFEVEAFEYIKEYSANFKLTKNCRNTNEIITISELFSKARIGEAKLKSPGPKVDIIDFLDEESSMHIISQKLEKYINDGFNYEDIVILSFVDFKDSSIRYVNDKWLNKITEINNLNIVSKEQNKILFSNIVDFKGLERNNVIVIDSHLTNINDESIRALLYTGLTRARINLSIIIDNKLSFELLKD